MGIKPELKLMLHESKVIFKIMIGVLPIGKMEHEIQNNGDPLIQRLYEKLIEATHFIKDQYRKDFNYKIGIATIYALNDHAYSEMIRFMLYHTRDIDLKAKHPRDFHINQVYDEAGGIDQDGG